MTISKGSDLTSKTVRRYLTEFGQELKPGTRAVSSIFRTMRATTSSGILKISVLATMEVVG